ncbi:MAG: precorrin-3B C(17)-methyltransferase [Kaiparowitsia implicata GSE-PSE-MK54-09C]|nr:precorrin-3B C(17)-methyltransferase [Kaiparowitsia implicata GSE-PSE-MK54-09C]
MADPAPAIVVLGAASLPTAQRIQSAMPAAQIYGLATRVQAIAVDHTMEQFGDTVRQLFAEGTPIIGLCAAGILIRTVAPLLSNKQHEPPLIAVAEDGSAVVPLLGGLRGVNDLARQVAMALGTAAAITTAGDLRFRTALLSPPAGYTLANPENAKTFIANLLAGATVQIAGEAAWLSASQLPTQDIGSLTIRISEKLGGAEETCLLYHPYRLVLALDDRLSTDPERAIAHVLSSIQHTGLATAAIALVVTLPEHVAHPGIGAIAQQLGVPLRLLPSPIKSEPAGETEAAGGSEDTRGSELAGGAVAALATQAVGPDGTLSSVGVGWAIATATQVLTPETVETIGQARGKLAIVGTGPGGAAWMSPQVTHLLRHATDWVGYRTYLNLVEPLWQGQQRHDSDNRQELDRARLALDLAAQGRSVAVVSSGDPGIYAMAAAVFEALEQSSNPAWQQIEIQVAPGISAMQAAAALVGAPLGHDFCAISLSDILKPWAAIAQRITAAVEADLVIAFYNPISSQRTWQLIEAKRLLLEGRSPHTPVILARSVGRPQQHIHPTTLAAFDPSEANMQTLIIVGSSQTRVVPRPHGQAWIYTPRQYPSG